MKLKIFKMHVEMDGASFEDNPKELARIVQEAAQRVTDIREGHRVTLRDVNGNTVGLMEIISSTVGG